MDSYSIVVEAVRNNHIAYMYLSNQVVGDKEVLGCLIVILKESLGGILQNKT